MAESAHVVRTPARKSDAGPGAGANRAEAHPMLERRATKSGASVHGTMLNARPAVAAQRVAVQRLGARPAGPRPVQAGSARPDVLDRQSASTGVIQRFTTVKAGKYEFRKSVHGDYAVGDGLSEVYAASGKPVAMSQKTSEVVKISKKDYEVWIPSMNVIEDCVAAAEELMHGKKLKYGVPGASKFRDSKDNLLFGGDKGDKEDLLDQKNRERGKLTNKGHAADPAVQEAYVIIRQATDQDAELPQFHGATVVARDGGDSVTLETSAPESGEPSAARVLPVYDMYGDKDEEQTFKTRHKEMYGEDASVSVLAAAELEAGAEDQADSEARIDWVAPRAKKKGRKGVAKKKATGARASAVAQLEAAAPAVRPTRPSSAAGNRTGLPDRLKDGMEGLSGLALDDVRVHYNSARPAQLEALAFTQGSDIHIGPGQERHLAHEAWHVVQQRQGRVKPTLRLGGVAVNDDTALEREADRAGAEAMRRPLSGDAASASLEAVPAGPGTEAATASRHDGVAQRVRIWQATQPPTLIETAELAQLSADQINLLIQQLGRHAQQHGDSILVAVADGMFAELSLAEYQELAAYRAASAGVQQAAPAEASGALEAAQQLPALDYRDAEEIDEDEAEPAIVNSQNLDDNCYYVTAAALLGTTADELVARTENMQLPTATIEQIATLYREVGLPSAYQHFTTLEEVEARIIDLAGGLDRRYALAYARAQPPGHVVVATYDSDDQVVTYYDYQVDRAWQEEAGVQNYYLFA